MIKRTQIAITEPSTHAGIAVLATLMGGIWPQYAGLLQAITAIFGVSAIALPEQRSQ